MSESAAREVFAGCEFAVNTTGSIAVREKLASFSAALPRLLEVCLFSEGEIGLLSAEGAYRNPNIRDLFLESVRLASESDAFSKIFESDLGRLPVGQGCGSPSMKVSDACISVFAASMAEILASTMPEVDGVGSIFLGTRDGAFGLQWQRHSVGRFVRLRDVDGRVEMRISPGVKAAIEDDIKRYPNLETGGALVGGVSPGSGVITLVDCLGAPAGSERTADRFVLNAEGMDRELQEVFSRTSGALRVVGTWHNHLTASGPSEIDHTALAALGKQLAEPAVVLIRATCGFTALVDICGKVYLLEEEP